MSASVRAPIPFPLPADLSGSTVGRFLVRHKLGSGGMGEVYYAEDVALRRPVALKRVSPAFRDPDARRRFLTEAQRASRISSEHIAVVFDVIEEAGEAFLVMEYVDGVSLRRRLQDVGRLSPDAFLSIAVQCAQALVDAQNRNLVHRDLKPENIMLTSDGRVKLLDFGLACRDASRIEDGATTLTRTGVAGTPGYAAPEILLEQPIDGRSDIFSLGVVFYEMLTGNNPFSAAQVIAATDRTLHFQPERLHALRADIPEELDRIISKMLAKTPGERYATAADLLVDLLALQHKHTVVRGTPRGPAGPSSALVLGLLSEAGANTRRWRLRIGVIAATMALALGSFWSYRWVAYRSAPPLPQNKQLAVLPFTADDNDSALQAFSRGLTETLSARLTQFADRYALQVVSPREVGPMISAAKARADLGVNLVLEGSLHQSGERVRVVYRLVDATSQRVLRADTVTAGLSDPLALEDRVVESAIHALDLAFADQQRGPAQHGTTRPLAYDFYLRGRGYLLDYQQPDNVESAIAVFQRAIEVDPEFALAYAGLGESYWRKYELTHDTRWMGKALDSCTQARSRGSGQTCLGTVYNGTGKYADAAREFSSALDVNPNDPDGYRGLAFAYEHLGRTADAEQTYRLALNLRPDYWGGYNWLGRFLYSQGRYGEAAEMFARVIELAPDNVRGHSNLCGIYIALGRYTDAAAPCERSVHIRPTQPAYSNLGTVYFYQHRFPEAAAAYEKAVRLDERLASSWGNLADAYAWQPGKQREAEAAYRKAISLAEEQLKVNPKDAILLSYLAVHRAMVHENSAATASIERALALSPHNADVQLNAAVVACQLGDHAKTIFWLTRALQSGASVELVRNYPSFDVLRRSRAFQQLLAEPPKTAIAR